MPRGAGLVYRHFGADDRQEIAYSLRRACWRRGAKLLIGADPALARAVGADGVHWPERLVAGRMGRQRQFRIETAAAHGVGGLLKAEAAGMDAVVLSPVFASDSPSAGAAFGLWRGSALARRAKLPVLALGGVDSDKSRALRVSGFAGFALVTGFAAAA